MEVAIISHLTVHKEKQFLIFTLPDNKTVKYDFNTGVSIGKRGKPVKNICSQLSGYNFKDVIDGIQEGHLKKMMADWKRINNDIYNIGTYLDRLKPKIHLEQFYSAGLDNVSFGLNYSIGDIPKSLIKLCRENPSIQLNNNTVENFMHNQNMWLLFFEMEYQSLSQDFAAEILSGTNNYWSTVGHLFKLVDEYGYSPKSLIMYVDRLMTYEAIDSASWVFRELVDYCNMMSSISDKFERYPKNFLTTFKIATRNYNRLKQEFPDELLVKRYQRDLSYKDRDYIVVTPKSTQDIKDEAVQQNNCVASYIQSVIDGNTHIVFMRNAELPEKSLVTLQLNGNKVTQAARRFNNEITDQDRAFIKKYEDYLSKQKGEKIVC